MIQGHEVEHLELHHLQPITNGTQSVRPDLQDIQYIGFLDERSNHPVPDHPLEGGILCRPSATVLAPTPSLLGGCSLDVPSP